MLIKWTDSIKEAVAETERRRKIQAAYNDAHGIIPTSAKSHIGESFFAQTETEEDKIFEETGLPLDPKEQQRFIESLRKRDV